MASQGTSPLLLLQGVLVSEFGFGQIAQPIATADPAGLPAANIATNFYAYYQTNYQTARQAYQNASNAFATAWQFARACFELGEFATNDNQRAAVAEEGIAASRAAILADPQQAAGHYYLGMNLGQLARTKNLGALKLVREMENAFQVARRLDAKFNQAGSDRCLGLLHRDAPGWPISVGNKRLARQYLTQAAQVAPDFPENQLNLAESFLMWDESKAAAAHLKTVEAVMAKARTNLAGMAWAASWHDWTNRWQVLTNRLVKR